MKDQRCYRCGFFFRGSCCPRCGHAVDFGDMDMRPADYLRLLGSLLRVLTGPLWPPCTGGDPGRPAGHGQTPLRPGGGIRPGASLSVQLSC
jgi:hypothetical protein